MNTQELQEAQSLAERLQAELALVTRALPISERTASGLARALEVNRITCQRMFGALSVASPNSLGKMPGIKSLRVVIETLRQKNWDEGVVERFRAAVDQYERFIDRVAGNQRGLADRLLLSRRPATEYPETTELGNDQALAPEAMDPADELECRRRLFEDARALMGCEVGVQLTIGVLAPSRLIEGRMDVGYINGMIRFVGRPGSVPLSYTHTTGTSSKRDDYQTIDGRSLFPVNSQIMLEEFSSQPPPKLSVLEQPRSLKFVIDPAGGVGTPMDFLYGISIRDAGPSAGLTRIPIHEAWAAINFPARALVSDKFLHKDMARKCIAGLDVQLWRPDASESVGDRWYSKVPSNVRLTLLDHGLEHAHSAFYPRQVELLTRMFNAMDLDPDDFVGFRCEVAYPHWRLGYRMYFDFGNQIENMPTTTP